MKEKVTVEAGTVFITNRTRAAIHREAAERTKEELNECYELLYDTMDSFGKKIAVEQITGQDFIIFTPERRIGKTAAALYLAHEYNIPYLIKHNNYDLSDTAGRGKRI